MTPATPHHLPRRAFAVALFAAFNAQAQTPATAEPLSTTLQTVTVTGKTNQGDMRPGALRDDIVKTESI